ncbi:MAG TPA: AraC family transcriptional regulator, partial [Ramlibacter sp.]|nr:AraC family transcriptional regulator [Ramlibacter sp.]
MQRLRLRSAALSGFPELARSLGLDPAALARQAGLRLASLASPDVLIPARAAYRLMELAAAASGAEDVGLRLARRRGLSHLGMLGLLARDEADVGAALRRIIVGMNLHSNCVTLDLREDDDVAMLTLEVLPDGEPVIRQSTEAGLGLLFQILVALLGPQWRPLQVQFVHARGASDRPHRALFGCPVRFSLDSNAVFLRRADLARPVPGADAGFRRFAPSAAAAGQAPDGRITPERVRQAMRLLLPGGACTSTAVAARLGVDRRTLHRHLARAD